MQEPSLSCAWEGGESYRFLWLRSFHAPVAVRIELNESGSSIFATQLSGAGGEPGIPAYEVRRALRDEERERFLLALVRAAFWKLPTTESQSGLDGAHWVLEGRSGKSYHVVNRHSPHSGAFRELCLIMLQIPHMPIGDDHDDIY